MEHVRDDKRSLTAEHRAFLLGVARRALGRRLAGGTDPAPGDASLFGSVPEALKGRAAVFVTLSLGRELKGCIGTLEARDPLYLAVARQAVLSGFHDPRFAPVTAGEVDALRIQISILGPSREVTGPEQIELGRHGIRLSKEGKQAVFLPSVPIEQGWDLERTLSELALKGGLSRDAWREGCRIQVFEVQTLNEEEGG
jgi:AmmeMemoRadiSam system protein A